MEEMAVAVIQFLTHGGGGAITLFIITGAACLFCFKGMPFILKLKEINKDNNEKADQQREEVLQLIQITNKNLRDHIESDSKINDCLFKQLKEIQLDSLKSKIVNDYIPYEERVWMGFRFLDLGGNHQIHDFIFNQLRDKDPDKFDTLQKSWNMSKEEKEKTINED